MSISYISTAGFAIALTVLLIWKTFINSINLPPGPPADLLIGHARKLPTNKAYEVYAKWKENYGTPVGIARVSCCNRGLSRGCYLHACFWSLHCDLKHSGCSPGFAGKEESLFLGSSTPTSSEDASTNAHKWIRTAETFTGVDGIIHSRSCLTVIVSANIVV